MSQPLGAIALVFDGYDEVEAFDVDALGFEVIEHLRGNRWDLLRRQTAAMPAADSCPRADGALRRMLRKQAVAMQPQINKLTTRQPKVTFKVDGLGQSHERLLGLKAILSPAQVVSLVVDLGGSSKCQSMLISGQKR